jgi:hypothetical protein
VATRAVRISETYCISLEEYSAILASQDGACGICGRKPRYNLDVDHDHAVERALRAQGVPECEAKRRSVRGLLCKLCNRRLLPAVRDDIVTLERAQVYLRSSLDAAQGILTD